MGNTSQLRLIFAINSPRFLWMSNILSSRAIENRYPSQTCVISRVSPTKAAHVYTIKLIKASDVLVRLISMQVEKYLHLSRARIESEIIPLSFSLANIILLIDQPSTNWYFGKLSSVNSFFWKGRIEEATFPCFLYSKHLLYLKLWFLGNLCKHWELCSS